MNHLELMSLIKTRYRKSATSIQSSSWEAWNRTAYQIAPPAEVVTNGNSASGQPSVVDANFWCQVNPTTGLWSVPTGTELNEDRVYYGELVLSTGNSAGGPDWGMWLIADYVKMVLSPVGTGGGFRFQPYVLQHSVLLRQYDAAGDPIFSNLNPIRYNGFFTHMNFGYLTLGVSPPDWPNQEFYDLTPMDFTASFNGYLIQL